MSPLRTSRLSSITIAAVLALSASSALAQFQRREPTPNDTLKSTEIASDRKVTFRIYAPKATDVSISGDFGTGGKLTKDDKGVWSITVGPLTPDFYTYTFSVDGVRTIDPKNPIVKQGIASLESMFLVPGAEAEFEATKDVPHGSIHIDGYHSATLNADRTMHIYTPPGYEQGSDRYPVLYLLHGGGDEDSGWSTIGRAGVIVDNLLAAQKARPFIIVMPNGSMPRPANLPRFTPGTPPTPEVRAAMETAQNRFTDELLKEVMPHVRKHYRVCWGAENQAIAGLSMGGAQTLRVLTTRPGEFGYVAIWSAGIFGGNAVDFEERNQAFFDAGKELNGKLKLLSISVGDKDFALNGSKSLAELFKKHGINHDLHISGGGHTWINWRHYLSELTPKLFR
jgi:enterochelin esterase family protein